MEESGGEFETSRDEMILPAHFIGNDEEVDKSYTGVSYKESLKNSNNRQGGSAAGDAPAAAPLSYHPAAHQYSSSSGPARLHSWRAPAQVAIHSCAPQPSRLAPAAVPHKNGFAGAGSPRHGCPVAASAAPLSPPAAVEEFPAQSVWSL